MELTADINASLTLQSSLDCVVEVGRELMASDFCDIALLNPDGETFSVRAAAGAPDEMMTQVYGHDGCIIGEVFRTGEPVICADLQTFNQPHPITWRSGIRSVIAVPLCHKQNDIFGAIFVGHFEPRTFVPADVTLLQMLAGHAAVAIENARLYESLQKSEHRYRSLVEGVDAIVWEVDAATLQCIFVSQQTEAMFGYPLEQWLSEPNFLVNHIHPEEHEQAVRYWTDAVTEGRDYEVEYRMITADGNIKWVQDVVTVVVDGNGRPVCLQGLRMDVTEQMQAEEALRKSEEQYRMLVETMNEGLGVQDKNGIITFVNDRLCEMFGYPRDEIIGLL